MQKHVSVFRDGPTLKEGCQLMKDIFAQQKDLKVRGPVLLLL